jgi:integrase
METTTSTATNSSAMTEAAATPTKGKRTRRRRGRRLNGEGTIYQRKDGRWCAEVASGDGKKKCLYAPTAEAVRAKLNATIEMLAKGQSLGDDRLTVAQHLTVFLDERRTRTRPATMVDYTNVVDNHLVPGLGTIRLRRLTAADVQRFLDEKRTTGLSATMVRHIRTILRMAMRLAVDRDLVVRNVVDSVRGPKAEQAEIVPLTADETRKLLETARTHPLGAIWFIVATLGLRRGEVLGLRWSDVDLERAKLSVRVQLATVDDDRDDTERKPREAKLVEPKSKRAVRDLVMAPAVVEALRARKRTQAEDRLRVGAWHDKHGLIFTAEDGTPLVGASISALHTSLCETARVRTVRFHDMRHGAASLMLAAGVDPRTLSEALGHSRVSFTLDTYAHVTQARLDDAVSRVAVAVLPRS